MLVFSFNYISINCGIFYCWSLVEKVLNFGHVSRTIYISPHRRTHVWYVYIVKKYRTYGAHKWHIYKSIITYRRKEGIKPIKYLQRVRVDVKMTILPLTQLVGSLSDKTTCCATPQKIWAWRGLHQKLSSPKPDGYDLMARPRPLPRLTVESSHGLHRLMQLTHLLGSTKRKANHSLQ